jgi:hypothetical protein
VTDARGNRGATVSGSAPESKGASAFTPINAARAFVVLTSDKLQFVEVRSEEHDKLKFIGH